MKEGPLFLGMLLVYSDARWKRRALIRQLYCNWRFATKTLLSNSAEIMCPSLHGHDCGNDHWRGVGRFDEESTYDMPLP